MRERILVGVAAIAIAAGTLMVTMGPADAARKWPVGERCGPFVYNPNGFAGVYWKHCTSGRQGVKLEIDVWHAFDRTVCVPANRIKAIGSQVDTRKARILGRR
ncbi:hypothetical protein ITP53_40640 [Nonomuraea sp. K274]|uniref:Uncharacterized protein n=1 Tax=Nonomuraea cypriaca TaxID=1187855 RepID=A0A931F1H2_9ACTN|nr:hypothetical protein [Nonomuraea cypriaca]MBF8191884.1 hypothetical protein [Nonomuraea cypriaca]